MLTVLASAIFAGYESISRFIHPREVQHLAAVAVASLIGFAGNEAVAVFRIKTGREIGSAALIADGYHARTDGLASLSVLVSAAGIALGFPLADPVVGLLMTGLILKIVVAFQSVSAGRKSNCATGSMNLAINQGQAMRSTLANFLVTQRMEISLATHMRSTLL